jgi:hypothetical protein
MSIEDVRCQSFPVMNDSGSSPQPAGVRVEYDEREISPEWDAFVLKCAVPHFEQTSF